MYACETEKPRRAIAERQGYLRDRLKHSAWLFTLDNGRHAGVARGIEYADSRYVQVGGRFNEPGRVTYGLAIAFSAETWAESERVFVSVGDTVDAYSAHITPDAATRTLRAYYGVASGRLPYVDRPEDMSESANLSAALTRIDRQLPRIGIPLTDLTHMNSDHPAQPKELGWINYWAAPTCEYLGFPDPQRDRDLLAHSYRTPAGAWLVKLCPEPLDLNRPEHLAIFADTYARFPKLGVRATEKKPDETLPISYPQNTVFIHERNLSHIVDLLVAFLLDRGLQVVERVPKGEAQSITVGVFPGASDWTIIKTIPEEFLGQKPPGVEEPRLVELCRAIRQEGFMLNVYNQVEAVLLETDGAGRKHVSGFRDEEGKLEDLSNVQALESMVVSFELLPIELDIFNLDDCGQLAQQLYTELGGKNADLCDNERFAASLDGKQLQERQGLKLRFVPL
jgi:hypothetical protein